MALSNMATPRAAQEKLTAVMPGMRTDFTGKAVRNVLRRTRLSLVETGTIRRHINVRDPLLPFGL